MNKIELVGNVTVSELQGQWGYYKEAYFENESTKEDLTEILVGFEGKRLKIIIEEV